MSNVLQKIKELIKRNMPVFVIGGLTVVIFLVIIFASTKNPNTNTNLIEVSENDLVAPHTYSKGPTNAKVKVVEFSDFGCPACKTFHPIMTKIFAMYPNDIRWSFRHFPLPQHKNSEQASVAAQAAGEQGKFWEYAEVLFENQGKFEKNDLTSYADLLSLDVKKFSENINNQTFKDIVKEDIAYGQKIGIESTPTFFINGKQLVIKEPGDLQIAIEKLLNTGETPQSTQSNKDVTPTTQIDPELLTLYNKIDEKFGVLEISFVDGMFDPKNTQAQAGQKVKWTNNTDKDIKFVQLAPFYQEFKETKTIKAGESLEFRFRLRKTGLWTYKPEGAMDRASILIMPVPDAYKDIIEKEQQ